MMRPHHLAAMVVFAVFGLGGTAVFGITESQLDCEQMAAKLDACCGPELVGEITCTSRGELCNSVGPTLDTHEVSCLERIDCATIRRENLCEGILHPEETLETRLIDAFCHSVRAAP